MDVVTLLPSATEVVSTLGVEPAGVSHQCDYPPSVASIPTVTRSRIDPGGGSADVNEAVNDARENHGGLYEIDRDRLADVDPDLIVAQGICDVCAVDEVLVREAVADRDLDAEVLTTDPHGLDDLLADVRGIGDALGRSARADDLIASMEARIDRVRSRAADASTRPEVAILDWLDPVMVAGHWIPEMVEIAGGTYGLASPGDRSRPRTFAEVRSHDPDVLVAAPCGFGLERILDDASSLTDRPGWASLTAVREGRVYAVDGDRYVNRPGPRLVDTLEFLAGVIRPDRFDSPPAAVARPLVESTVDR